MDAIHVKNSKLIVLPQIVDGVDGTISVAEYANPIPFIVKRVYYIYNLENQNAIRGKHAHKNLEQVLFCINGTCEITLDDGTDSQTLVLNRPNIGIYLGIELWITINKFSGNCILLVLASDVYKESDYIRDYEEFIRFLDRR